MQSRPFSSANPGPNKESMETSSVSASKLPCDELARVFNTAVVSTRNEEARDFSNELFSLVQTPAYEAILSAVRTLAQTQALTELQAAEQVIQTFRKLDLVWNGYIYREGVAKLRG
jgi:hypothetical protein